MGNLTLREEAVLTPDANVSIKSLIHVIRGEQVILDSDLAMLYEVETGNLNKAAARNSARFPEDFRFRLTKEEYDSLIFQFGSSNEQTGRGGRRKLPYAYTEQGIAMLSVDITTGDIVVPGVASYDYPLMFDEGTLAVSAYPLETVLAEKLETCVRRGIANTRGHDFYDLWALLHTCGERIDSTLLRDSLLATAEKRGSSEAVFAYEGVLIEVRDSRAMWNVWAAYVESAPYTEGLSFEEVIDAALEIAQTAFG